jgi:hypothetical protein
MRLEATLSFVALCVSCVLATTSVDVLVNQEARVGRVLLGGNSYTQGEVVPLWASKVGPFSNPRSVKRNKDP